MFKAKVVLDSISPAGKRLITMELTYPRFIHAEFMTHRMFSRNAASSRAIPTRKMIAMVEDNPAMPIFWGKNKKGMSPTKEIERINDAKSMWLDARDDAVDWAYSLYDLGVHKQIVNRILEPWKFITVICTATEWSNFFALRDHVDAQQEIAHLAKLMKQAQDKSEPILRMWHLPYVFNVETLETINSRDFNDWLKISVARCARVSYLTHDGKRDFEKDLVLHDRLLTGSGHGHWSPFEHVAQAHKNSEHCSGNFIGWTQYRKMHKNECQ